MVVTEEIGVKQLGELLKEVQAGNEVLLTQNRQPIARLVPAETPKVGNGAPLRIRSFKGHQVLAPSISQADITDEMFG
jgi:antitoxin (DNA-binding transcriptional repressor) of toxin-antitoxin stability system